MCTDCSGMEIPCRVRFERLEQAVLGIAAAVGIYCHENRKMPPVALGESSLILSPVTGCPCPACELGHRLESIRADQPCPSYTE